MAKRAVSNGKSISVKLGELAKALKVEKARAGITLDEFLAAHKLRSNGNVLVNASKVAGSFQLRDGDLVTTLGHVAGGL